MSRGNRRAVLDAREDETVTHPDTPQRLAPRDRRTPVFVARDTCPLGESCVCCPKMQRHGRGAHDCREAHPPQDRECSPPFPAKIPPCPERDALEQKPPASGHAQQTAHYSCCVDCGRVTARRWTDPFGRVLPWCAGRFPEPDEAST